MTIDEYLSLAYKLRRKYDHCEKKYRRLFDIATSTPSSLDWDGAPKQRGTGHNSVEAKFVAEADAARELSIVSKVYREYREQLRGDIYNLRYWEGLLLEQAYITNPILGRDLLYRADEILSTNNHKIICAKLDEAKQHLAELMIARGAEIDNNYRAEQKASRQAEDNLQDGKRSGDSVN